MIMLAAAENIKCRSDYTSEATSASRLFTYCIINIRYAHRLLYASDAARYCQREQALRSQ